MISGSAGNGTRAPVAGGSTVHELRGLLTRQSAGFRGDLAEVRQLLNDAVAQLQQGFAGMTQQIASRDRLLQDLLTLLLPGEREAGGAQGLQGYAAEAAGLVSAVAQRSTEGARWTLEHLQAVSGMLAEASAVVSGIEQLATQIRFLSLNAAVEAARAGDRYPTFGEIAKQVERVSSETARLNSDVGAAIGLTQMSLSDVIDRATSVSRELEEQAGVLRARADEMAAFISACTTAAEEVRQPVSLSVTALQLDDVVGQILGRLQARMLEFERHVSQIVARASCSGGTAEETGSSPPPPAPVAPAAPAPVDHRPGNGAGAGTPRQFRPGTVELF